MFGVWHQAHNVSGFIRNPSDIAVTTIGVVTNVRGDHPVLREKFIQFRFTRNIATLTIFQWDNNLLPRYKVSCPQRFGAFNLQFLVDTYEMLMIIAGKGPWQ
jgi:hypothetical protein